MALPRSAVAILYLALTLSAAFCAYPTYSRADTLSYLSDLIDDSAPSTAANHVITFTTSGAIPASGQIVITPENGAFTVPVALDYKAFDLATSNGGPYVDRTLAASASATADGISADSSTGIITITLNSTAGIAAGSTIRLLVGTIATFEATSSAMLVNPPVDSSYRIDIITKDSGGVTLANAKTMIAIVQPVGVSMLPPQVPPLRFNGFPQGTIAANTQLIELSLEVNKPSTCRFATTTGVTFDSMNVANTFSQLDGGLLQTIVLSGFSNGTTYSFYVRCRDGQGLTNPDDFPIIFSLDVTPISNTSVFTAGFIGSGGSGPYPNGSSVLYLSNITLSGWASPGATVTVLNEGAIVGHTAADTEGKFTFTITGLERGSYTVLAYSTDSQGRTSSSFSSTLSVTQGTDNIISNIIIPPTIELQNKDVGSNDTVTISGETIPDGLVQVSILPQGSIESVSTGTIFSATSTASGVWSLSFPASQFAVGVYEARARVIQSANSRSDYGAVQFLGIGQKTAVNTGACALTGDLNCDGKVNLVDFSILLSNWNTNESLADLNKDGSVGLPDFSILLFNWTG